MTCGEKKGKRLGAVQEERLGQREAVVGRGCSRIVYGRREFRLKLNDIILNVLKLEYLKGGIRLWWNGM